jgi:hypothetical protein
MLAHIATNYATSFFILPKTNYLSKKSPFDVAEFIARVARPAMKSGADAFDGVKLQQEFESAIGHLWDLHGSVRSGVFWVCFVLFCFG